MTHSRRMPYRRGDGLIIHSHSFRQMAVFVRSRKAESDGESDLEIDMDGGGDGIDDDIRRQIKKRADRRARRRLKEKQKQISMEEEVLKVRQKIARAKKKSGAELAGTWWLDELNLFVKTAVLLKRKSSRRSSAWKAAWLVARGSVNGCLPWMFQW